MKYRNFWYIFSSLFLLGLLCGCSGPVPYTRAGYLPKEPDWIKNGEPLVYENQNWYPTEDVENLKDDEVECIAEYKKIPFYAEKIQIKPFNRLYTRFGKNKYRQFSKSDIK